MTLATKLRILADKYATNELDRDTYRNERRQFLDAVEAGSIQLEQIRYSAVRSLSAKKKKLQVLLLFVGISIIFTISLLIGLLLFKDTKKNDMQTHPQTMMMTNPGISLLEDFLEENIWTKDTMDKFISSWVLLEPQQREELNTTTTMKQLIQKIEQQMRERRDLAAIGGGFSKQVAAQGELLQFANALGIDTQSMKKYIIE